MQNIKIFMLSTSAFSQDGVADWIYHLVLKNIKQWCSNIGQQAVQEGNKRRETNVMSWTLLPACCLESVSRMRCRQEESNQGRGSLWNGKTELRTWGGQVAIIYTTECGRRERASGREHVRNQYMFLRRSLQLSMDSAHAWEETNQGAGIKYQKEADRTSPRAQRNILCFHQSEWEHLKIQAIKSRIPRGYCFSGGSNYTSAPA